jgi:predicted sulfurtransferase
MAAAAAAAQEVVKAEMARSVIGRELPPVPPGLAEDSVTLCLFYQYVEPMWTKTQHKKARSFVIGLGAKLNVTGRGRCAAEGLNCTLTGSPEAVRKFCKGLRAWNPLFEETDFKLTDGLASKERFKALTVRKTDELVAYGLAGENAPSLRENSTKHLEAIDYHNMMKEKDTVIIDVRNAYESAIGHFQPPPGGAELIDPRMRNSHEFPKWLNAPETQAKLTGKKVMMYCTGGIRCERASALLDSMSSTSDTLKPKEIVMVRGGIERYMRTFPEGGYWKGKNFLFDKRFEQVPELKPMESLEKDVESVCCRCKAPCAEYRGQHTCPKPGCSVPVIVCAECQEAAKEDPSKNICPLCEEGFQLRDLAKPDLEQLSGIKQKRTDQGSNGKPKKQRVEGPPSSRLFVGKIPLVIDATKLKNALGGGVKHIHWLADKSTGLFYGSAFVEMDSVADATRSLDRAASSKGVVIGKKRLRLAYAAPKEGEVWPPADFKQLERPRIPF